MTAPSNLVRLPLQMLGDLVSPRALERIFQDAAAARSLEVGALDSAALEDILKREVFKRLQLSVPAPLAKKRVSEVLGELMKATQERAQPGQAVSQLLALEEQARKYTLYFDWPETQRLRGVLSVARQEEQAGRDVLALLQEGQGLVGQMERRLQEGLVAQAQDLAELRAAYTRVQGMGNREVRRLDGLITQIDEAQKEGTLLPGEVERAKDITFKLRKLLESSVVQQVADPQAAPAPLDPQAQARVLALEQEHAGQQLSGIEREFDSLLLARPDLQVRQMKLRGQQHSGTLSSDAVDGWREELKIVRETVLIEQRTQFMTLELGLSAVSGGADVRVALDAARHILDQGNLATDELRELQGTLSALNSGADQHLQQAQVARQRDLLEIERSARKVPGASRDLAPLIAQAQQQLAAGQDIDLDTLWAVLERHMGAAAQEREDFDARADHVVSQYDSVRSLAGETTQRLGRLADTLRAQRRLGPMSAQARERYAQTLIDAEALLAEARAEYRAAQEVTATFGQDALSDLLDVFDMDAAPGSSAPAPPAPAPTGSTAPTGLHFDFDALTAQPAAAPPAAAPPAAPAAASATPTPPMSPASAAETWELEGCLLMSGPKDPVTVPLANLIAQADELQLTHLHLSSDAYLWEARRDFEGRWRVTRTPR